MDAIETHLRYEPEKVSKSRIKRLEGLEWPQYRLRIGDIRAFYDVFYLHESGVVEVLAIAPRMRPCGGLRVWEKARMIQIPLNKVKDDLSRYLRMAEKEDIIITRHGIPAGILIGFEDPEAWWEELLLREPASGNAWPRHAAACATGKASASSSSARTHDAAQTARAEE